MGRGLRKIRSCEEKSWKVSLISLHLTFPNIVDDRLLLDFDFSENIRRFLLFLTLAMTFSKRKEPEGWTHFISWLHQSKKGFSNWNHLFWPQLEVKCRLAIFLHFSPNFENISFLKCFRNILLSDNIINSAVKVTGDPHIRI